jgi:hypothetical protein
MGGHLTSQQRDALFDQLCIELGFCLRPDEIARVLKDQPDDVYSFTNAVFSVGGANPERVGGDMWWQVRQRVAAAFGEQPLPNESSEFRPGRGTHDRTPNAGGYA